MCSLPYLGREIECIPTIIASVKDTVEKEDQRFVYNEIANVICERAKYIFDNHRGGIVDASKMQYDAIHLVYSFVNALIAAYPNKDFVDVEITCIKNGLHMHSIVINKYINENNAEQRKLYTDWVQYVKQYVPTYAAPEIPALTTEERIKENMQQGNKTCQQKHESAKNNNKKMQLSETLGCILGIVVFVAVVSWIISMLANFFNW